MAKFNSPSTVRTVNREGHVAYDMAPKAKLVTQVLTSFFNEKKFYCDNSDEMKETIEQVIRQDPEFVSKLAVFARREFNMRSVSHVLTAYLAHEVKGKPFARETVKGVSLRGDDATEIMSFYLSEFGKPVPNSLKKGIADVLRGFDEYTLAKYKGDAKSVKMKDLLCICRPRPVDATQEALWKRCLEDKLATPMTWETELSANGNNQETWEKLIDSNKVGYMALLRNFRNIVKAHPWNFNKVLNYIRNPEAVLNSKQLPFRFLSAYKSLIEDDSLAYSSSVLDALEDAVDISVMNLPKIPGKTVIAIDGSGSMGMGISERSSVPCYEIALLLGIIANRICEEAIVLQFDTDIAPLRVSTRDGILRTVTDSDCWGGGTNMSLPFDYMIRHGIKPDRVIVLSDNECNTDGYYWRRSMTIGQVADECRRELDHDFWVHAIDIMGYGTQQFKGPKTNVIAGWSEKVFEFILLAESGEGSLEEKISNYCW